MTAPMVTMRCALCRVDMPLRIDTLSFECPSCTSSIPKSTAERLMAASHREIAEFCGIIGRWEKGEAAKAAAAASTRTPLDQLADDCEVMAERWQAAAQRAVSPAFFQRALGRAETFAEVSAVIRRGLAEPFPAPPTSDTATKIDAPSWRPGDPRHGS